MASLAQFVCSLGAFFALFLVLNPSSVAQNRTTSPRQGETQMHILQKASVQKELDLSKSQVKEIKQLYQGFRDFRTKSYAGFDKLSRNEIRNRMLQVSKTLTKRSREIEKEIDRILLQPQKERLSQIMTQSRIARRLPSTGSELLDRSLAKELGIDAEQQKKIKAAVRKVRKELDEEIAKLKRKKKKEILKLLSPEQRKKYETIFGKDFDVATLQPGYEPLEDDDENE